MRKWSVVLVVVAVVLLARVEGQQRDRDQDSRWRRDAFVQGELLVKFSSSLSRSQRDAILSNRRFTRIRRFDALDIDLVRVPQWLAVAAAAGALRGVSGVALAQPNYMRYAVQSAPPGDPFWLEGRLWGLERIQAPSVWSAFSHGDSSVVVASIDTGINYQHPDLAPNMWRNPLEVAGNGRDDDGNGYVDDVFGIDSLNHDGNPLDDHGHGTLTAGIMAAAGNNDVGGVGVNWNASLLACKFLGADGSGTDAGAIECFNYIVGLRNRGVNIRVSCNGWGAARNDEAPAGALKAAIDAAGAAGILNVFGAGNGDDDNDRERFDPASLRSSSIISVASSGRSDRRSRFSNYGGDSVDLAAPGEDILTTYRGDYGYASGTSMAAAHVAGTAALLASLDPTQSVEGIKAVLIATVDRSPHWAGKVASGGRLNAFRAAKAVGVGPNKPPTVSIQSPVNGAMLTMPVAVTIGAVAGDADGSVQKVVFYADGAPIGTATASPFSVPWSQVAAGLHTLTAMATDNLGATTTSASVSVTVAAPNVPPVVSLASPGAGASFLAPATIPISATATDADGQVSLVTFYANGVAIGSDSVSPFAVTWSDVPAGTYTLTAMATDNAGATSLSNATVVTVFSPVRMNVALDANGGVASASSTFTANYPEAGANNGDRRGLNWGSGGGWNDGTLNASPDWLVIDFNGSKTIDEVSVFSLQDAYTAPIDPTPTLAFTLWGLRAFEIQYWNGADWAPVPGASVANNNLVWRRFTFAPVTTTRIRVFITAALNGSSRVTEVEAWGTAAFGSPAAVDLLPRGFDAAGIDAPDSRRRRRDP